MYIQPISNTNFYAKKLTPLIEFSGPILKLTPKEQIEVDALQKEIHKCETDAYEISRRLDSKKIYGDIRRQFEYALSDLYTEIRILEREIKEIKMHRFQIQKSRFNKNK